VVAVVEAMVVVHKMDTMEDLAAVARTNQDLQIRGTVAQELQDKDSAEAILAAVEVVKFLEVAAVEPEVQGRMDLLAGAVVLPIGHFTQEMAVTEFKTQSRELQFGTLAVVPVVALVLMQTFKAPMA